jgi:hypothetical protein
VNFVELARSTDDFNGAQLKVRGQRRSQKRWDFTQQKLGISAKIEPRKHGTSSPKIVIQQDKFNQHGFI